MAVCPDMVAASYRKLEPAHPDSDQSLFWARISVHYYHVKASLKIVSDEQILFMRDLRLHWEVTAKKTVGVTRCGHVTRGKCRDGFCLYDTANV
jgi:hypothetical protein